MSSKNLNLLLLGGSHVGDSSDRFELTKNKFETVDTVFIESVTGSDSLATKMVNFLKAPIIVSVAVIVLYGELIVGLICGGDGELKQKIVDEYDAEVIEIDESFHPTIESAPYFWPLSNYAFLFAVYVVYAEFGLTFDIMTFGFVTVTVFLLYLAATLYGRDAQMALDIEQYAQIHSGNACAIVGGHHEKGLKNRLTNSTNVQIVPQEN